jgi:hypothetical protein
MSTVEGFHSTVVHETVEERDVTCNLHVKHHRVAVLRRYDLEIVEKRTVPDLFTRAWAPGSDATRTGYRAVDQFGDEWTCDWNGAHGDGGRGAWVTTDGRRAESASLDGTPRHTLEGWIDAEPT